MATQRNSGSTRNQRTQGGARGKPQPAACDANMGSALSECLQKEGISYRGYLNGPLASHHPDDKSLYFRYVDNDGRGVYFKARLQPKGYMNSIQYKIKYKSL